MEDELNFQIGISGEGLSMEETEQAVQNMQEAEQERAVLREQNAQIEEAKLEANKPEEGVNPCLLYTSPSPRDLSTSRMPSSA